MKRFGLFALSLTLILPVLLGGCAKGGVKYLGKVQLENGEFVEYSSAKVTDFAGQDMGLIDSFYTDSTGTNHLGTVHSEGPGLGKSFLPAAANAGGYVLGQALRRPDEYNSSYSNTNTSEGSQANADAAGGDAMAEGGAGGEGGSARSNSSAEADARAKADADARANNNSRNWTPRKKVIRPGDRHFDKDGADLRQETKEKDKKQIKKD